ncbi:MAG TPA: DUF5995 family protein [Holophagaceae bacterium]|nr:DUF5995 family protein [Holophagaceae bacterium]HJW43181.1 DUF5995 family protein [Geothrix sp.]
MGFTPAQDIHDVIARLDALVEDFRSGGSRLGYFPALYRRVTVAVREGIAQGRFQDGPRMDRLDTVFANRYLEALAAWQSGAPCSACWRVAFEAADRWRPTILQHLLAGMAAHIQFDLGIAAATVAPGPALAALKSDFMAINGVLTDLTGPVQAALDELSPWMRLLDRAGGNLDEALARFGMGAARDGAWAFAERLASLPQEGWGPHLAEADASVAELAGLIPRPGPILSGLCLLVRIPEAGDPRKVIETLA